MNESELKEALKILSESFKNEVSVYFSEKGITVNLENIDFSVVQGNPKIKNVTAFDLVLPTSVDAAVINFVKCKKNKHGQIVCEVKK